MSDLANLAHDVTILNISFGSEWVSVTYVDKVDVTGVVVDTVTREFRRNADDEFEEDIQILLDSARSLVDKGAVAKRNPPSSFTRAR